jgi:hypothetical protein
VLGRGWPDDRAGLGKRAAGNLDGSDRRDKDKATTQKEDRRKRNKSEPSSRLGAIQDGTTGSLQDQLVLKAAEAAEERRQKKKEEKKRSKKDPGRELLKILTTQLSSHKKHKMKDKKEEKEKEKREKRRPGDSTWGELPGFEWRTRLHWVCRGGEFKHQWTFLSKESGGRDQDQCFRCWWIMPGIREARRANQKER